jgi:hypothetical protein
MYGADTAESPLFVERFENPYPKAHTSLRVPWLMALGNHDCAGNPEAEVAYTLRSLYWKMPSRYYTRSYAVPGAAYPLRIIVLDACSLVCDSGGTLCLKLAVLVLVKVLLRCC